MIYQRISISNCSAVCRRLANFWFGIRRGKKTLWMKLQPRSLRQLSVELRRMAGNQAGRGWDQKRRRETDLKMAKRRTGRHPRRQAKGRNGRHHHLNLFLIQSHPLLVQALTLPNLLPKARLQMRLGKCFFCVNLLWFPSLICPNNLHIFFYPYKM